MSDTNRLEASNLEDVSSHKLHGPCSREGFRGFLFSRPKDQRLTGADMTTAPLHVSALRRGIRSSPPETTEGGKNKPEGRMLTRDVQIIEYINNISGEVKKESKVLMVWYDME